MKCLSTIFALSIALLITGNHAIAGKLYKWVSEDGSVFYSDKVPPKAITGEHSELNESGIQVKHHAAASTAAEIAIEKQKEFLRKQQQMILKEQNIKDTALLKTFRSVDDIIFARDGKLATYGTQIKLTHKNIQNLKARLLTLQERAAKYERQGKKTDDKLIKGISNTNNEIRDSYSSILRREKDKKLISQEYDKSLTRFRELKHLKEEHNKTSNKTDSGSINATDFSLVDTAVVCDNGPQCDKYWQAARAYGKAYATTGTQLDAGNIYLSMPPVSIEDISVTVSRVRPRKSGNEVIFLDIQCKPTISGIELCNGKRLNNARAAFKSTVMKAQSDSQLSQGE